MWPSNQLCKFAQVQLFGRASGCVSTATVRSSKLRYVIDEYMVRAIRTEQVQQMVITMAMTFDRQDQMRCKLQEAPGEKCGED